MYNYDDRFNILLENAKEITRSDTGDVERSVGSVFCKGSTITDIMLKEGFVEIQ